MLLGLVADIHEDVESLDTALGRFRQRQVDLVVSLGDACDSFSDIGRSREVVALLREARAVGVWGNHDFGLCTNVRDDVRAEAGSEVLEFMAGMKPQLVVDDIRFSHVEPWLDANRFEDLWYYEGPPDTVEQASSSFAAVPERLMFLGHFHCWLAMTRSGRVAWTGDRPLNLIDDERYLIVVAPVVCGWCATYDTERSELLPLRCGEPA